VQGITEKGVFAGPKKKGEKKVGGNGERKERADDEKNAVGAKAGVERREGYMKRKGNKTGPSCQGQNTRC